MTCTTNKSTAATGTSVVSWHLLPGQGWEPCRPHWRTFCAGGGPLKPLQQTQGYKDSICGSDGHGVEKMSHCLGQPLNLSMALLKQ